MDQDDRRLEIERVLKWRFPDVADLLDVPADSNLNKNVRRQVAKARAYKATLDAMSSDELGGESSDCSMEAAMEQSEQEFHIAATADLSYWAKAAYWTNDEAAALLLGKSPDSVNSKRLNDQYVPSESWDRFSQLHELLKRAFISKDLGSRPVRPATIIEWAISKDIPCPEELLEVLGRYTDSADQKPPEASRNELLQKAANELAARWKAEGRKLITKEDIAKALASGPDWYEMTADRIMRIIRVEWR